MRGHFMWALSEKPCSGRGTVLELSSGVRYLRRARQGAAHTCEASTTAEHSTQHSSQQDVQACPVLHPHHGSRSSRLQSPSLLRHSAVMSVSLIVTSCSEGSRPRPAPVPPHTRSSDTPPDATSCRVKPGRGPLRLVLCSANVVSDVASLAQAGASVVARRASCQEGCMQCGGAHLVKAYTQTHLNQGLRVPRRPVLPCTLRLLSKL